MVTACLLLLLLFCCCGCRCSSFSVLVLVKVVVGGAIEDDSVVGGFYELGALM